MGNCPNPHCDGSLVSFIDFDEYGCSVGCDTCPFSIPTDGPIEEEMSRLYAEMEEKATQWVLNHLSDFIPEDRDWDEWEQQKFRLMQYTIAHSAYPPNGSYWESRGVVFERKDS